MTSFNGILTSAVFVINITLSFVYSYLSTLYTRHINGRAKRYVGGRSYQEISETQAIGGAAPPSALSLPSDVVRALTAGLIDVGQLIALAMYLSVLGIVLSALIYGFSRIFDEVGSHFALE
jgi:hypothetical protein